MSRVAVLVVSACLGAAMMSQGIAADDPWAAVLADNVARSQGRALDQLSNPAYIAARADACRNATEANSCAGDGDPFRTSARWNGTRGTVLEVAWTTAGGDQLAGTLYGPPMPTLEAGALPAVVFVPGLNTAAGTPPYRWATQGLAERGYVVLIFTPRHAPGPLDPKLPHEEPCLTTWDPPPDDWPVRAALDDPSHVQAAQYRPECDRFVGSARDALDFLLSEENPWHGFIDAERVGMAGHSLGGWTSAMLGHYDERIKVVASLDAYAYVEDHVTMRTPTIILQSEQTTGVVRTAPPERQSGTSHPLRHTWLALQEECVSTMFLVLRGSTHFEFQYTGPENAPGLTASSKGERVALHYLLAWFDLHLLGIDDLPRAGHERKHAIERLKASTFDGTSDDSSIGAGSWDGTANVPHTIAGETRDEHLSRIFDSDAGPLVCNLS